MDDSSRVGLTLVFLRTSKAEIKCALGEIKNGNESPDILSTFITQRCDIAHRPKVTHKVWAGGWHGWWKLLKGLALSGSRPTIPSSLFSEFSFRMCRQAGRQRLGRDISLNLNRSTETMFVFAPPISGRWPACWTGDGSNPMGGDRTYEQMSLRFWLSFVITGGVGQPGYGGSDARYDGFYLLFWMLRLEEL